MDLDINLMHINAIMQAKWLDFYPLVESWCVVNGEDYNLQGIIPFHKCVLDRIHLN